MKKLSALILVIALSLPCAAQAYLIEYGLGPHMSNAHSWSFTGDKHGDQADVTMSMTGVPGSYAEGPDLAGRYGMSAEGEFMFFVLPEPGDSLNQSVNVTLTTYFSADSFATVVPEGPLKGSYNAVIRDDIGEGADELLTKSYDNEAFYPPQSAPYATMSDVQYDTLTLALGEVYFLAFDMSSWFPDGFSSADLKFSLDVQGAVTPIPGAVWLLGTGLVGLVGLRRKRS